MLLLYLPGRRDRRAPPLLSHAHSRSSRERQASKGKHKIPILLTTCNAPWNLKKSQREKVSSYEISWVKTFLHKAHDSCGGQPRKLINPTTKKRLLWLRLARYHIRERHFTTGEPWRPGPGVTIVIVSVIIAWTSRVDFRGWVETNSWCSSLMIKDNQSYLAFSWDYERFSVAKPGTKALHISQ